MYQETLSVGKCGKPNKVGNSHLAMPWRLPSGHEDIQVGHLLRKFARLPAVFSSLMLSLQEDMIFLMWLKQESTPPIWEWSIQPINGDLGVVYDCLNHIIYIYNYYIIDIYIYI